MQSSWTAGVNENFVGMTLLEAKRLLGVKPFGEGNVSCTHNVSAHVDVSVLPTDFDARTTWPTFVHAVRDQGQCGSCWAHAASETFSDKLAIATNGSVNEIFSVQELVSCDTAKDMGCGGGWPEYAFNYMMTKGLPSDTCYPYTSGQGDSGTCLSACKDGSAKMLTTHKIKSWDYVNGEEAMMNALVTGPIAVAFAVYEDFFLQVWCLRAQQGQRPCRLPRCQDGWLRCHHRPQASEVLDRRQQLGPLMGQPGLLPDPERRRRLRHRVRTS